MISAYLRRNVSIWDPESYSLYLYLRLPCLVPLEPFWPTWFVEEHLILICIRNVPRTFEVSLSPTIHTAQLSCGLMPSQTTVIRSYAFSCTLVWSNATNIQSHTTVIPSRTMSYNLIRAHTTLIESHVISYNLIFCYVCLFHCDCFIYFICFVCFVCFVCFLRLNQKRSWKCF